MGQAQYQIETRNELKVFFIKCLEETLGIVTAACARAGICKDTYYEWLKADPAFKEKALATNEVVHDFVENQLLTNIKLGDVASIIFYAKTKLKHRGYIERTELTGAGGGAIQIEHKLSDVERQLLGELPVIVAIEEKK